MTKFRPRLIPRYAVPFVLVYIGFGVTVVSHNGTAAPTPANVPDAVRAQLGNLYRITVDPLRPGAPQPSVSAAAAIATAKTNFDFVKGGPPAAFPMTMTDVHSGRLTGTHVPGVLSPFTPTAVDRPVWVVVIPSAEIMLSGPAKGADSRPNSYIGELCVFIDASTGEYIKAVAVPST